METNRKAPGTFLLFMLVFIFIISGCNLQQPATPAAPPVSGSNATLAPVSTDTATLAPVSSLTSTALSTASPTTTGTPQGIGNTWTRPADGMVMVYVSAGNFSMGSAVNDVVAAFHPVHTAYLDAYWIDRTDVTNAMYALCVKVGKCSPPEVNFSATRPNYYANAQYANYPVIYVSWMQAQTYCAWAGARLPTEAEWEKAARGTDGRIYPWGNASPTKDLANSNSIVGDTTPVGSYPAGASPYGALDMAGNVYQWVSDWYGDSYYANSPLSNPQGAASGLYKIRRGGGWDSVDKVTRSDFHLVYTTPHLPLNDLGMRCARPGDTSVVVPTPTLIPTQTPNPLHPTLADFFLRCPTAAEIADLKTRLTLTFPGDPTVGTQACTAAAGSADLDPLQKRAYQTVIILKYLKFDVPLPWTDKQLYDWFTTNVRGITYEYHPGAAQGLNKDYNYDYCCDPGGIIHMNVHPGDLLMTENAWVNGNGDPGPGGDMGTGLEFVTAIYVHEARHADNNFGILHDCANKTKDNTVAEMGAYGVEYYYFYWLAYHSDRDFLLAPGFNPNTYRQAAIFDANFVRSIGFCNDPIVTPVPYPTISNPFPTNVP